MPQLLGSLQQCEIRVTFPLTTQVAASINVKEGCIQNKGNNFPNDCFFFLPLSHPFSPFYSHSTALVCTTVVAS